MQHTWVNRCTGAKERSMGEVRTHETGVVIPFPDMASRSLRLIPPSSGPRGEILLFTGIRYEWQSEPTPAPSAPLLPGGTTSRTGRRRRRP
jgi:hypothetical protein